MMDLKSPEGSGLDIDFSSLSAEESEHILHVIHQDFLLRYLEKDRLCDLESELLVENTETGILPEVELNSKLCTRCLSRFIVFFNKRLVCSGCGLYICKHCCEYSAADRSYFCSLCMKQWELRRQSSAWFYSNVHKKFKRCGSAKVIWHFYKQRLLHANNAVQNSDSDAVSDWLEFMKKSNNEEAAVNRDVGDTQVDVATMERLSSDVTCPHAVNRPAELDLLTYCSSTPTGHTPLALQELNGGVSRHTKHGSKYCNDNRLLKLAEDVIGTQGKTSSLAEKMLDSASLIQMMSKKLDEMDQSLHDLQTQLSTLDHETDVNLDSDCQQTSLNVMSGLTTTAFQVLSCASDLAFDDSLFSSSLLHKQQPEPAHQQQQQQLAENVDSCVQTSNCIQSTTNTSTASTALLTAVEFSDDVFKTIEKQIYMTSSEVFMLEDHIQQLETQVLSTDETSTHDVITALEGEIALTIARVGHTATEVNTIEQQIKAVLSHTSN